VSASTFQSQLNMAYYSQLDTVCARVYFLRLAVLVLAVYCLASYISLVDIILNSSSVNPSHDGISFVQLLHKLNLFILSASINIFVYLETDFSSGAPCFRLVYIHFSFFLNGEYPSFSRRSINSR